MTSADAAISAAFKRWTEDRKRGAADALAGRPLLRGQSEQYWLGYRDEFEQNDVAGLKPWEPKE